MANAAALWQSLLAHVASCAHCVMLPDGSMDLCDRGARLYGEFEEQERTERYRSHPDPSQAGMELLERQGKARIVRVTPAQLDAIDAIDRSDYDGFFAALQGILDEATFQSLAKDAIQDIQFEADR